MSSQRALLVASIQDAIANPIKDMPDPEELFAQFLKEEINMELWGNKEGIPNEILVSEEALKIIAKHSI